MKKFWSKLKYWQKGLIIGLAIGLLFPTLFLIFQILRFPHELYSNGSFQCTGYEHPSSPCSFTRAMGFLIKDWFLIEYIFSIPSLIIGILLGTIIGIVYSKFRK